MPNSQTRSLARRLDSLEKWRLQSKQPTLGFSTIEEGALQVVDEDETLRSTVGLQPDGTYTVVDVNGPPPPTPLEPTVDTQPGLLVVSSYGLTVDGSPWPLDFRRLDVHVSTSAGFTPDLNTRVSEFSVDGGAVSLALPVGTYYVKLVAVSTSGTKSIPSVEVSRTVSPPATGAGGAALYRSDSPPVGLGPDDQAVWYDTDNGNLQSFWDGNSWEPMPLGPGATAEDVIAGKKVPLAARVELEWGVPDPNEAFQLPTVSLEPLYPNIPTPTGADVADTSYTGLVVDETGKYVQIQGIQDQATGNRNFRLAYVDPAAGGAVTYGQFIDALNVRLVLTDGQVVNKYNASGITKIGTTWYVISNSAMSGSTLFWFNEAWTLLGQKAVGDAPSGSPQIRSLSNDGTNLLVLRDADVGLAAAAPTKIEAYNPATWVVGSTPVSSITTNIPNANSPGLILPLANYSFGAPRYVLLSAVGDFFPSYTAHVLDSTGTQVDEYDINLGMFTNGGVTGMRWNATTSRFEFAGSYGAIYRNTTNSSDKSVWIAYTLYDSVADPDTHESALSPVYTSAVTVPRWNGIEVYAEVPDVDDAQAPDTIRTYARVGDATQPAAADMDLQTSIPHPGGPFTVAGSRFIPDPVNGGAAPPTVSSFPAAPSGEIVSELGGMIWRGDGTMDVPYLDRKYDARYDARYAGKLHTHDSYDAMFRLLEPLSPKVDAHQSALTGIGAADGSFPTASSTASGSYTRTLDFVRIGNLVICSGEVDRASGFNSSLHDTGARVPVGFRPVANVLSPAMLGWASGTANYRYRVDAAAADLVTPSAVNIQQSAAISSFQVAQLTWITADPMP